MSFQTCLDFPSLWLLLSNAAIHQLVLLFFHECVRVSFSQFARKRPSGPKSKCSCNFIRGHKISSCRSSSFAFLAAGCHGAHSSSVFSVECLAPDRWKRFLMSLPFWYYLVDVVTFLQVYSPILHYLLYFLRKGMRNKRIKKNDSISTVEDKFY